MYRGAPGSVGAPNPLWAVAADLSFRGKFIRSGLSKTVEMVWLAV